MNMQNVNDLLNTPVPALRTDQIYRLQRASQVGGARQAAAELGAIVGESLDIEHRLFRQDFCKWRGNISLLDRRWR